MQQDLDTPEDYLYLQSCLRRKSIPTLDQCRRILFENGVGEQVKEHCSMVTVIAMEMASRLNKAGAELDMDLILTGALMHDVAYGKPDHAQAGARLLESRGYPLLAEVVSVHTDIEVSESHPLTESEIVFLAGKMIKGRHIVSVKDRFAVELEKYKNNPQASTAVVKRWKQAERIMLKIEKITGGPVESVPVSDFHL